MERLAFASTETAPDRPSVDSDIAVTFEDRNAGTLVPIVQKGFATPETRGFHERGLPDALDRLNRVKHERISGSRGGLGPS